MEKKNFKVTVRKRQMKCWGHLMEKEGFSNLTYTGYIEEKGSRENREYPILGV